MIVIKAGPQDTSDSLIRKFNKKVLAEGILQELKKKEFYQKPSLVRKQKRAERKKKKYTKYYTRYYNS